jgi:TolA-binding protein
MRAPEDPCRDPASEARDDHASEPTTPETDALAPSQGRIRTMREYIDELEMHARRLERQRDELMEELEYIEASGLSARHLGDIARAAIAAVKGGNG